MLYLMSRQDDRLYSLLMSSCLNSSFFKIIRNVAYLELHQNHYICCNCDIKLRIGKGSINFPACLFVFKQSKINQQLKIITRFASNRKDGESL